jgi:hypothetical protein
MKVINTVQGDNYQKIIDFTGVDSIRNTVCINVQQSRYNSPKEEILINTLSENDKAKILSVVVNNFLDSNPDYTIISNFNDWLYPDKLKRIFLTNDQIAWFTANAKTFIDQVYNNENPFVKIDGGFEVYMNNPDPEAIPILENLGVIIQDRP